MKKIGLIFATREELDELYNQIGNHKTINLYDLEIYETIMEENTCYLIESGIGKVNAARAAQILIDKLGVDIILNVGVAGSLSPQLKIGDIVIAQKLVQHDFDLTAFGREKGFIPNVGKYIPCDKNLLEKAEQMQTGATFFGVIASGDVFMDNKEVSKQIREEYDALCVEMEGAAIAQACYLSNIPFLVLRAISDSTEEDDNKTTFEEFLTESSKTIANYLLEFIKKIKD